MPGGGTVGAPRRIAVVFPGQGTQKPGMGIPWRDRPGWEIVDRLEATTGEPIGELLTEAPAERLSRTREAQLSVFATSLVAWAARRAELPEPVAFAGHSLGQLTALVAAGCLSIEAGAGLVLARAEATQAAADAEPGRMVALLGADLATARAACAPAPERCWVANDNAPGQVVLGGTPAGVEAASARARDLGVRKIVPLDVGGAFHTPMMEPARQVLGPVFGGTPFAQPTAPVIHNGDARAHADDQWAERMADQLVQPVRWRESVETMAALGVGEVVEVGPGTTLTGLVHRTMPDLVVSAR